ncbi:MAG TPA: retroviral-like aspartic protease family protein [Nostocaceae cyanobacterium]|nr:retroviral-like aspartic protease family protein [Nostocaceae cyanobacterium]
MYQPLLSRTALIFLSGSLAVMGVACTQNQQKNPPAANEPMSNMAAIEPPKPKAPSAVPQPKPALNQPNVLEMALDKATGAMTISKSAQSPDDWDLVANQYEDAIALLRQVGRNSPNYPVAQRKIAEYQRQIRFAQQQAQPQLATPDSPPKEVVIIVPPPTNTTRVATNRYVNKPTPKPSPRQSVLAASASTSTPSELVFIAPVKRRVGGTPVVEVTFNGQQRFEMIVDTGASGTVITQEMAQALGVVPVGVAKANTVSSRNVEFPIGYIDSMELGGVVVNKVPVAIAGRELETGLLGHDFFGNYDVTIRRNVVEFRPQISSVTNFAENELNPPVYSRGYRFVGSL